MSITKTNCSIHWPEIYPVDSTIHLSNNWGQIYWIDSELSRALSGFLRDSVNKVSYFLKNVIR